MHNCQQGGPLGVADGLAKIAPQRLSTPVMTCALGQFFLAVSHHVSRRCGEPARARS